jgi:uncharacterized protein (TIGR02145 family)
MKSVYKLDFYASLIICNEKKTNINKIRLIIMSKKIRIWIHSLFKLIVLLILINSCKKEKDQLKLPVVTTSEITGITSNRAFCGGTILSDITVSVTECGVCWSTAQTPTIADNKSISGSGVVSLGSFTCEIKDLTSNSTYFISAYATNSAGTAYGQVLLITTAPTLTDIDGNVYSTVTIGTQTWMAENLKTTKYNDDTAVPNVTDETEWANLTTGAYCWYDNNASAYKATYGALYNWYAINTGKLCPTGWHVPSDAEWLTLENYLGGEDVAGGKLKEAGTTHWLSPNTGATNETGFTGLPGGFRWDWGTEFWPIGQSGFWWLATEPYAWHLDTGGTIILGVDILPEKIGASVRCLKN